MYHYIYDSFLADPKHAKTLASVENRLTDLGIYGSVHRLALFKNMKGTVQDAVRRGAKTIIAVGDDGTVAKGIDAVAAYPGITFGIIPIGEKHTIADLLGIPSESGACDVLSARLIEDLDLGKFNNHFFLTSLHLKGEVQAECDGRFTVSAVEGGEIQVCNLGVGDHGDSNPRDGRFETMVKTVRTGFFRSLLTPTFAAATISVFPTQKVVIRAQGNGHVAALADGQPYQDAEFRVEIVPKRLRVIVGKQRII